MLVAEDQPRVYQHQRELDGSWSYLYGEGHGLDASITLAALGTSLLLADIYEGIDFS